MIDARRIGQARALHAQRACGALLEGASSCASCQGSLAPSVSIGSTTCTISAALNSAGGNGEHIGEVVLALRVVVAQCSSQRRSGSPSATMMPVLTSRISALLLVGVLLLDDAGDAAFGIAHHAAVAGGIGQVGDQHRDAARRGEQALQRLGADQRHIAVEHQYARVVGHVRHRLLHRMAGTELLRLLGPEQVVLIAEGTAHGFAAMAVDDMDAGWASARALSITCASIGLPAIFCSTLGSSTSCACPRRRRG